MIAGGGKTHLGLVQRESAATMPASMHCTLHVIVPLRLAIVVPEVQFSTQSRHLHL